MRLDALSSVFVMMLLFLSISLVQSEFCKIFVFKNFVLMFFSISLIIALNLDPPLVGLALTYSLSLNGMFQYCIRQSAEVENYVSF